MVRSFYLVLCSIVCFAQATLAQQTVGLFQNDVEAYVGYTMFNKNGIAKLIDNAGIEVHSWPGQNRFFPGYFLDSGNTIVFNGTDFTEMAWDGTEIWSFSDAAAHHDVAILPNGNVLMLIRETFTAAEAFAQGRDPATLIDPIIWGLHIIEVAFPGTIVWEWHVWDHLVQDYDSLLPNFGVVADSPERIDFNFIHNAEDDWIHSNAIAYNPDLDQIVVTARRFSELWVIDHSTSTAEAATTSGGNSGRGGEILYRWGNPMTYGAGTLADRQLHGPHDAHWIEAGLEGAGNILIFDNGTSAYDGPDYSTVIEITPPTSGFDYSLTLGSEFLPVAPTWTYEGAPPTDFFSYYISGAQRLPNGNTLINQGDGGRIFEVTSAGDIVWEYICPLSPSTPSTELNWDSEITTKTNDLFRAYRYPPDHPGYFGKSLVPTDAIEIWDNYVNLTMQSEPGGASISRPEGTHLYGDGQLVTLTAEADTGFEFLGWTVEAGTASIGDPSALHTTFTMGAMDATVQANFGEITVEVPSMSFWGAPLIFLLLITATAAIGKKRRITDGPGA